MAQFLPANPRPSAWQQMGTQISQGLGKGLEAGMNATISEKMEALKEQRHMEQAAQQRSVFAHAARSKGYSNLADLIEMGMDPDKAIGLAAQMPQVFQPDTGKGPGASIGPEGAMRGLVQPQRAGMGGMNELQPIEEREAVEEAPNYGKRIDNTEKGRGWLGPQQMRDGSGKVATELATTVNVDGKNMLIPTLVPTLTEAEKDHLLQGGKPTPAIIDKAIRHAKEMESKGKGPFFGETAPEEAKIEPEEKGPLKTIADFTKEINATFNNGKGPLSTSQKEQARKQVKDAWEAYRDTKKMEAAKKTEAFREEEPERKRYYDEVANVDKLRTSSRFEDQADALMETAIKNDDLGLLSLNNLAMQLNAPGLLSPDAAVYNAAIKELFVGGLASVPGSSRLNMWIEQQIKSMIPMIGTSRPAALAMLEVLKGKNALNKKSIQLQDELDQKYPKQYQKILREKSRLMDEYSYTLQKQTAYNIQKIKDDDQKQKDPYSFNSMKTVTPGTPLTVEKARVFLDKAGGDKKRAIKMAEHFGYEVRTLNEETPKQ